MNNPQLLRRKAAATYLQSRYSFGTVKTLAKLACVGGGPEYQKFGSKIVLYDPAKLDEWVQARLGAARRSTSEAI